MKSRNKFSFKISNQIKKIMRRFQTGLLSAVCSISILALALTLTSGCGSNPGPGTESIGNSGSNPGPGTESIGNSGDTGDVIISLTDDEGDFVTYTVDVVSLTLTRADGTIVQTLPFTASIDFAQYTEMTEFFTVATIPAGRYTHAEMKLDYSNANIQVETANGEAVSVEPRDSNGNPIKELNVTVKLDDRRSLVIVPGVPAHLTLDFDLEASNVVDLSSDPPVVTVEPLLIADVEPEHPKIHRLRGLLQSVDTETETFKVRIRHFRHWKTDLGVIEVMTSEDTAYEINGESFTGSEGLAVLSEMPPGIPMLVIGNMKIHPRMKLHPRRFEAREVYAGSSVYWGTRDVVTGNVIAREGDVLTVRGKIIVRANNSVVFNTDVTVYIGSDTKVTRQALPGDELTIDNISVGQRITAFGTLKETQAGNLELDATSGHVRMLVTTLRGTVKEVDPGLLVIDLQTIDRRRVNIFDFSGTGRNSEMDADPSNYEIDTGNLDLGLFEPSDPVMVRGFVRPFGQAPEDFTAQTVIDVSARESRMDIVWKDKGTTEPFTELSPDRIIIDLNENEIGKLHHVFRAGIVTDLLDLIPPSPTIQPKESGRGRFAIWQNGSIQVFYTFENFVEEMEHRLDGTNRIKHLKAVGYFDDNTVTMTAVTIVVKIH